MKLYCSLNIPQYTYAQNTNLNMMVCTNILLYSPLILNILYSIHHRCLYQH